MRLVLTGGGTMGHVLPNIAVIEELKTQCGLKDEKLEILYIGSYKGPEAAYVKNFASKLKGVRLVYKPVFTGKLRRYFSFKNLLDGFLIPLGVTQAFLSLMRFKPKFVFSKGGFVSLPVCVAARLAKIPLILHESDTTPGLANKICARFAQTICISFEETKKFFKSGDVVLTGNPVRKEIFKGDKELAYKLTHFDRKKKVILVMGGSQGASQINTLIRNNLNDLLKNFSIIHIVGAGHVNAKLAQKGYLQYEYIDTDLKHFYALADYIISRGGANSLAEISALGKPAMIIPLMHSGRGDQVHNARAFSKSFASVLLEGEINDAKFLKALAKLLKLKSYRGQKNEACKKIVKELL